MSKTAIYEPTDPAAIWAAGRRVPEDRRLALTEDEARYELLAGTIRPVEDKSQLRKRGQDAPTAAVEA
jgi:hypothetical protein